MRWRIGCAAMLTTTVLACGGTPAGGDARSGAGASRSVSSAPAAQKISVPTTEPPSNGCDWIPAADVEAIVGKFAKPPEPTDDCLYTLVIPDEIRALREKERRVFEGRPGELAAQLAEKAKQTSDPANYAITLKVDPSGAGETILANKAIAKLFASELGGSTDNAEKAPTETAAAGWDQEDAIPYGFSGRTGHLRIMVQGESPDVPSAPMASLAARVRDRIPDLPFPAKNLYQVPIDIPPNADACGLVTRAEAEAVLGPLVDPPYRSSSYFPSLAHPAGNSCTYFTAGHHVFVVTPTWIDGATSFALDKGIGRLIGTVMPQEAVILKGTWDKSQITSSGTLDFLKGDRLLEVNFLMSSTDRAGAVKLATQAMRRLSAMNITTRTEPREARVAPGAGGTEPGWSRIVKLSDGRTMVADGAFMLDAALAKPAVLPKDEAAGETMERFLTASLPDEIALTQLTSGPRPRTYAGPDRVLFNADYIDYLRRALPANRVKIRLGGRSPAVIMLDGKPVGLIMPLAS
jgi:hypothetical protein